MLCDGTKVMHRNLEPDHRILIILRYKDIDGIFDIYPGTRNGKRRKNGMS